MEPTRETFGNIPAAWQHLFYLAATAAALVFCYGVWRRLRLWRQGRPVAVRELLAGRLGDIAARLKPGLRRLAVEGLGQSRVLGHGAAGGAHVLLFAGFMMLFLGTTLLEIDHVASMISRDLSFQHGTYYVVYKATLDVSGLLFLSGCAYFLWRRALRPASLGHRAADWWVLASFIAIALTGYLLEALRITWQRPQGLGAHCSPVGLFVSHAFAGLDEAAARRAHFGVWWLHAALVLCFIAAIPFTRLFHVVAGPLNLFFAGPSLGALQLVTVEEVERTGQLGIGAIRHLTQQQLLSLDACMECGRCQDACPAYATGKPLSPKALVQDLKRLMEDTLGPPRGAAPPRPLHSGTIRAETLWACTACSACVDVCPVRVNQVTLILGMRRHLVAEGGLSGTAANALRRIQSAANPWGLPAGDRPAWREALNS